MPNSALNDPARRVPSPSDCAPNERLRNDEPQGPKTAQAAPSYRTNPSSASSAAHKCGLCNHHHQYQIDHEDDLTLPKRRPRSGPTRRTTKSAIRRLISRSEPSEPRGRRAPLVLARGLVSAMGACCRLATLLAILTLIITLHSSLFLTPTVQGYNLDHQKALPKRGPSGSYFGYSIAQHETFDESNRNATYRSYVIVGAPRDNPRTALGVQRPGAIYKCDFSRSEKCHQLDLDSIAHLSHHHSHNQAAAAPLNSASTSIYATTPAGGDSRNSAGSPTGFITAGSRDPVVQRDDQWLGVSVKSQGANGFAAACAHRYVLKGPNYRWPQGICYSLTKNLTLHRAWEPCYNRPVNKAHEEYGSCQVGTSVDINNNSDIVLGSPGPYTWRGTVFSNSITFRAKDDRTWYMAPVQDEEAKVYKYSYLGMSIVTGAFFNGHQYYISGAPRSNEIGQVLVMTKQSSLGGRRADSTLKTEQILDGEQMASAFGYTLAKMDFNGDSRLDLVVAAPFYYSKNEGGAVYLYSNNGKSFSPAGRLTGQPESRFGFALANCGDLNHDKYEDLAIGAPYDQGGGSVYIYLGSAAGMKSTPSQVIKASQALQTFGYSLSGGVDMDQNGYPDLAVGSYADDTVYIIRARPIIEISTKIEGNLSRIDPNRTTCDGERNQLPCFKFNTCFELDPAKIGEYSDSMKLKYRIEAETFTGQKYSRVKFQDSENSDRPNVVEREIMIDDYHRSIKLKRCNTQRVYLKDRSDVQTPIQFKLEYWLVAPDESKSSSSSSTRYKSNQLISSSYSSSYTSSSSSSSSSAPTNNQLATLSTSSSSSSSSDGQASLPAPFPILNQEEAQRIFSAKFLKDCGANDICESHLDVDGTLQMPRETLGINEPGYPSDKQVNVTIRVANNNEPAYEARLFVTHPANLIYSGFKATKQVSLVECTAVERNLVKCELGNPMPKGSTKLLMIFNTQNQAGTFDFNLMVNTTSQNAKEARTSYDLSGTIRRKVELQVPTKQPPIYPEPPMQETSIWRILLAILLGILVISATLWCLNAYGFFDRPKPRYVAANTEERFN